MEILKLNILEYKVPTGLWNYIHVHYITFVHTIAICHGNIQNFVT